MYSNAISSSSHSIMAEGSSLANNPFVALFPTIQQAQQFRDEVEKHRDLLFGPFPSSKPSSPVDELMAGASDDSEEHEDMRIKREISFIVENIFLITVDKVLSGSQLRPTRCVYLSDLHQVVGERDWLDVACLEEALFERVMMEKPENATVVTRDDGDDTGAEQEASEEHTFRYLYMCYYRSVKQKELVKGKHDLTIRDCQTIILANARMVLCHPDIYEGQATARQFVQLFLEMSTMQEHQDRVGEFLERLFKEIEMANHSGEEEVSLSEACHPILDLLLEKCRSFSLADTSLLVHLQVIHFFTRIPCLAKVLIGHSTPRTLTLGKAYETTLIGTILRISCVPRSEMGPFEFFDHPSQFSQQEHSITERNLWNPIDNLNIEMHKLFSRLLRVSTDVRHLFLNWLGNCFQSNAGRAKLWTHVQSLLTTDVSDAFMLNMGSVLLRLCKPFSEPLSLKLLKVDPSYCAAVASSEEEVKLRGIYLRDLHRETCLITSAQGDQRTKPNSTYNFTTICFFMTHRCLCLGFNTLHEKFVRLNQELARVQRLYEEARTQGGENSDPVQNIKNTMERGMSQFLCTKAAMLEPNSLEMMLNFHIASATWLVHVATAEDLLEYEPIKFPLSAVIPQCLACIPEFIMDGIAEFVIFLRRFNAKTLEMCGNNLEHMMTFILIFMGSRERVKNPHLRAKLAEMLEALMPHADNRGYNSLVNYYHREKLFKEHPHVKELVPVLLNVFVSIEMTGQSVAFEQKFNYRRPMYIVMDYIWGIELHRNAFKRMATDAESHMEDTQPPLFLRFINLLINDAIFLLDEALSYMTRLKEQQQLRDSGEIQQLPPDQRQQNEANFQHMGMLARFHNVMGNSTIHILELLTQEIKSIFTHQSIVDRIAAMLNYFLLHLVGPKRKQLKVKDLTEYEFKPHDVVRDICAIYVHLGSNKDFCGAVSRDGRSYSAELFILAEQVLHKIGQVSVVTDLKNVANIVKELAKKQLAEDEAIADAPEEFLDPIMGTLMSDPVLLPSSKVIVDRATIARHLLSDQTDPFNRSPLTMDLVKSDTDLKARIEAWMKESRQKCTKSPEKPDAASTSS